MDIKHIQLKQPYIVKTMRHFLMNYETLQNLDVEF